MNTNHGEGEENEEDPLPGSPVRARAARRLSNNYAVLRCFFISALRQSPSASRAPFEKEHVAETSDPPGERRWGPPSPRNLNAVEERLEEFPCSF